MSKVIMHQVEGKTCFISNIGRVDHVYLKKRSHYIPSCPLCRVDMKLGEGITLVGSNFQLFPNITIHTKCYKGEESAIRILNDYREFKEIKSKYRHWM